MESSIDFNSNSTNRFGAKSRNMFFVRHTAAPRHLKTIFGIDGITVCSMKDNDYKLPQEIKNKIDSMFSKTSINYRSMNNLDAISSQKSHPKQEYITDPKFKIKFNTDYNKDLLNSYLKYIKPKNVKERIFPPIKHFTATYTLGLDTNNWQLELNNLGKMIGIMTADEIRKETNRLAELRKNNYNNTLSNDFESMNNLTRSFIMPKRQFTSVNLRSSQQNLDNLDFSFQYDERDDISKANRLNETRKSTNRPNTKSKSKHTSSGKSNESKFILCNDERDREIWLLKILSQILDTESLLDVQTWLVSADRDEKNAMKDLISKAIEGLNQSSRVDLHQLVINPNDKQTQVDFEKINDSVNKLVENKASSNAILNDAALKTNNNERINNQNLVESNKTNQDKICPVIVKEINTQSNSLSLNPRLSADFFKMINKNKIRLHKSNTCLNIKTFKEKENKNTGNNDLNFSDNLEFPARTIKSYDITTTNCKSDPEKPKKHVDILTLD